MFRQHAWETGSSWAGEGAIRYLLSADAEAARIRRQAIIQIFPLCDPDGVATGGVRFNRHGFDLNRNWDTVDPVRMPEIAAQRKAVLDWIDSGRRVDLFLSLHNTETNEYLEGPPDPAYRPLMERWFRLLAENTTFNPQQPPRLAESTTTPGKPGRMTVVQGLYRDRHIPAFLMEQMISYNSKLAHLPEVPDRLAFGAALARTLLPAVTSPKF
jgi:murein tripeptide amidase MpaA